MFSSTFRSISTRSSASLPTIMRMPLSFNTNNITLSLSKSRPLFSSNHSFLSLSSPPSRLFSTPSTPNSSSSSSSPLSSSPFSPSTFSPSAYVTRLTNSTSQQLFHETHIALVVLTPIAMILSPSILNFPVDLALGVIVPFHAHKGMVGVLEDYVPRPQQSLAKMLMVGATLLCGIGILKINLCGPGLTETFKTFWREPKVAEKENDSGKEKGKGKGNDQSKSKKKVGGNVKLSEAEANQEIFNEIMAGGKKQ